MKSWMDTQLFFVVDSEFCQNEADDPKDAIIFFSPFDTSDSVRCTLCCHIMGICRFMKLSFGSVKLIHLSKCKFAIQSVGKYILALQGNLDMPDTILQRQLSFMIDLFHFHYKSFEAMQSDESKENRSVYLDKMSCIWSLLLSLSQRHGDSLSLTLNVVPAIELPKTAGLLFLQASQFLQACQRFTGVYSGCLFCNQKVLCSQLPLCILQKMVFIWENQRRPGHSVPVAFELPGSVNLLYIYLTRSEVHDLKFACNGDHSRPRDKPTKTETNKLEENADDVGDGPETESNSKKSNYEVHVQQQYEQQPPSVSSFNAEDSKEALKRLCEDSLDDETDSHAIPHNGTRSHLELENISNCSTSSYDSCANADSDPIAMAKSNVENPLQTQLISSATDSVHDVLENSCSSSEATITQDTLESLSFASESAGAKSSIFNAEASELNYSSKVDQTDLHQFVLYQQGYNDIVVVLILDTACISNSSTIHGLWKLGMNTMMSLETDVRSCLEMSPNKITEPNGECGYLYLQYDRNWNRMQGNILTRKGGNSLGQQVFHRSVQLMHEDLQRDRRIYEMTVCSQDMVFYAHKMGSRETYYHHSSPVQSFVTPEKNVGFPLQSDEMCTIATGAKQKLEKEHRIVLL